MGASSGSAMPTQTSVLHRPFEALTGSDLCSMSETVAVRSSRDGRSSTGASFPRAPRDDVRAWDDARRTDWLCVQGSSFLVRRADV